MEFVGWLNILLALIIVLAFAVAAIIWHFKSLEKELDDEWFRLLQLIQRRADKIPLMIDLMKEKNIKFDYSKLIELRAAAMALRQCSGNKVSRELELTAELNELVKTNESKEALMKETAYLDIVRDLQENEEKVERELEIYNKKVREYNVWIGSALFKPFSHYLRLHRRHIFEFES